MKEDMEMENVPQTQLDNRMAKARPVKLGWEEHEAVEISNALNSLLACYSVHYQKLRNFHWNVRGADFFELHNQFEIQYNEARENLDTIAERIRVFDKTPFSSFQEYIDHSTIQEAPSTLASDLMVREILTDYTHLLEAMYEAHDVAVQYGDSGTEDMMMDFITNIEKHHWMFSAFLAK